MENAGTASAVGTTNPVTMGFNPWEDNTQIKPSAIGTAAAIADHNSGGKSAPA